MIERRRIASPTRFSSTWTPSLSGPRWRIASFIARSTEASIGLGSASEQIPTMPHIARSPAPQPRAELACERPPVAQAQYLEARAVDEADEEVEEQAYGALSDLAPHRRPTQRDREVVDVAQQPARAH